MKADHKEIKNTQVEKIGGDKYEIFQGNLEMKEKQNYETMIQDIEVEEASYHPHYKAARNL